MKYYIKKSGYGKYIVYKPVSCSDAEAKELKSEGYKIFNTREQAIAYAKKKNRERNG